jgi:hypothetical protein
MSSRGNDNWRGRSSGGRNGRGSRGRNGRGRGRGSRGDSNGIGGRSGRGYQYQSNRNGSSYDESRTQHNNVTISKKPTKQEYNTTQKKNISTRWINTDIQNYIEKNGSSLTYDEYETYIKTEKFQKYAEDAKRFGLYNIIRYYGKYQNLKRVLDNVIKNNLVSKIDTTDKSWMIYNSLYYYPSSDISEGVLERFSEATDILHKQNSDLFAENKYGETALGAILMAKELNEKEKKERYKILITGITTEQIQKIVSKILNKCCGDNKDSKVKNGKLREILIFCIAINPKIALKVASTYIIDSSSNRGLTSPVKWDNFYRQRILFLNDTLNIIGNGLKNIKPEFKDLELFFKLYNFAMSKKSLIDIFQQEMIDYDPIFKPSNNAYTVDVEHIKNKSMTRQICKSGAIGEICNILSVQSVALNYTESILRTEYENKYDYSTSLKSAIRCLVQTKKCNTNIRTLLAKVYTGQKHVLEGGIKTILLNLFELIEGRSVTDLEIKKWANDNACSEYSKENIFSHEQLDNKKNIDTDNLPNQKKLQTILLGYKDLGVDDMLEDSIYTIERILKNKNISKKDIAHKIVLELVENFTPVFDNKQRKTISSKFKGDISKIIFEVSKLVDSSNIKDAQKIIKKDYLDLIDCPYGELMISLF